jgi:sec-independent protein translocase protein TatA
MMIFKIISTQNTVILNRLGVPERRKQMIGGIGMPELIVILVIVLIIFGANKLPQIGEGLGKGIRNFKKGIKDKEEINITSKKPEEISAEKNKE